MNRNKKVAIIGVGTTDFGDLYDSSLSDLAVEAFYDSVKDAKIETDKIEAMYIGNMGSEMFLHQEHIGALIASHAGINVPAFKIEAAAASGAVAIRTALHGILSGSQDLVSVIGVEKMTEFVNQSQIQAALSTALNSTWESNFGGTLAAGFALMAKAHMRKFGTTREQIAMVAVKNHENASINPKAQFSNKVRVSTILNSKMLADPLRLFDTTAACDGAAAIVLASADVAESYDSEPIYIYASKHGTAPLALHSRESLTEFSGTKYAAKAAYKQVGITSKDINVAEVHDIFTIAEIIAIESLGLVPEGQGGPATENGTTALTGEIPVNTSGGLKGRGAPLGAVGVAQAIEIYEQFKNNAGQRQLKGLNWGLSHSLGGTGGTSIVTVYGR